MLYTVITGASSGIGYEAALAFATRGKNLILTARREKNLEELKSKVTEMNTEIDVVIMTADLAENEEVYDFYERTKEYEVETWINNAGFGNFDSISHQELPKIEKMLRLNNEALTILTSLYVRDYAEQQGTQLINVSSGGGYTIVGGAVTYCATKFFVSAFTEGLAQELQAQGSPMQAKVLAPAATETEFVKRSMDVNQFSYEENVPQYHTAEEMAQFMLDLYDSDKVVGIVDGETYEFHLKDPLYPYVNRNRK
ncbi:SDR family NAD(P)-dependent oxidoreductase [Halobacillus faecis]